MGFGDRNTAVGAGTLLSNTTGSDNTASGAFALFSNTSGNGNIALGIDAGSNITTGINNIDIGNFGVDIDNNTIRIGTSGIQTFTYISGIRGTHTMIGDALPVVIDSNNQLGTSSSSRRFKKQVKPMDKTSEAILALNPVTFQYKSDSKGTPQFGLIAEDVAEVNPDLVVRDKNGEIYTVRYDAVNAMLLNEFLKEHKTVRQQAREIQEQKSIISQLKKDVETVVARLKEQDSKIQRISDQREITRPSRHVVLTSEK